MICPETEVSCTNNCSITDRCAHWKDQGLSAPTSYGSGSPGPTPSITVGTQVRLTGEVVGYDSLAHPERVEVAIEGARTQSSSYVWVKKSTLEVIRQPFKRGEVVWSCGAVATGIAFQVLADETDSGDVLLIKESDEGGNRSFAAHHSDFERRP